jgi:sterol desaturase/sphingolipid hydroxylase (fatty acid hydroxylase superfamily)
MGSLLFSPIDMLGWTLFSSICLGLVVATPESGTWVLYATTLLGDFQHSNIRTPSWARYLVQRPESHSAHHQRGVHAYNYSDVPLFDMRLGTCRNPAKFAANQGFWTGASNRISAMILFRDVSVPPKTSLEGY